MQNNYINNFGFVQVRNNFNFVVNNYYASDVGSGGFKDGQEKTAEREASRETTKVEGFNSIDWDLAEEYEENINEEKEKFLPSIWSWWPHPGSEPAGRQWPPWQWPEAVSVLGLNWPRRRSAPYHTPPADV